MLRIATIKDFRVNASEVIRRAEKGDRVIVTRKGYPVAMLIAVSDEELEDIILATHPYFLGKYEESRKVYEKKGGKTVNELIEEARNQLEKKIHGKSKPQGRKRP